MGIKILLTFHTSGMMPVAGIQCPHFVDFSKK